MKLKKILALACSLVMASSMFVATANAAVDGATATLEFAGYETKGAATFAVINVKATIPDTLIPYELVAADWVEIFEDTYKGKMVQTVGFDIPNVDGLSYTASLSSCADYVQLQNNTAANKVVIYAANTGAYDTYYAGTVDTLATLYYRITGDVSATYNVALSDAVIGLVTINETTGAATPSEYTFSDFTVTNAVIKPEEEEEATLAISATQNKKTETGYIWDVTLTKGATAPTAFDAKFTDSNDEIAERTIRNFADLVSAKLPEGTGSATFKVGLSTSRTLKAVEFKVTDAAGSATWTN